VAQGGLTQRLPETSEQPKSGIAQAIFSEKMQRKSNDQEID
jgi:hypothetical protein